MRLAGPPCAWNGSASGSAPMLASVGRLWPQNSGSYMHKSTSKGPQLDGGSTLSLPTGHHCFRFPFPCSRLFPELHLPPRPSRPAQSCGIIPHPYPSHRLGSCAVIQETTALGPSELQPGLCHSFSTCFPYTSPTREREVVEGTFWPQACFLLQKTSKGSVAEERASVFKQENRIAFVC